MWDAGICLVFCGVLTSRCSLLLHQLCAALPVLLHQLSRPPAVGVVIVQVMLGESEEVKEERRYCAMFPDYHAQFDDIAADANKGRLREDPKQMALEAALAAGARSRARGR